MRVRVPVSSKTTRSGDMARTYGRLRVIDGDTTDPTAEGGAA
jgi:hypothetical protein